MNFRLYLLCLLFLDLCMVGDGTVHSSTRLYFSALPFRLLLTLPNPPRTKFPSSSSFPLLELRPSHTCITLLVKLSPSVSLPQLRLDLRILLLRDA